MNRDEAVNKLHLDFLDCIERIEEDLPPYEVGNLLIALGTKLLLDTAPSLLAYKTINASVENGIKWHEDNI